MKTKDKIFWRTVQVILIAVRILFSTGAAFFCNFIIFMYPVMYTVNFSIKDNLLFVAIMLIAYPIFFFLMHKYLLKHKLQSLHKIIDDLRRGVRENFEIDKENRENQE